MGRRFGCGGGKGKGLGVGKGRGCGYGQGMGAGLGWQSGSAQVPAAPRNDAKAGHVVSTESRHMIAVVDTDRCTGCGICIDACLEQAMSVDGVAVVDPGRCVGCGACLVQCPNEALALCRHASTPGVAG